MSKRIIVRKNDVNPRITIEPYFDILNEYLQRCIIENNNHRNEEVKNSIVAWEECIDDPENPELCDECTIGKFQDWINEQHIKVPGCNLCDLIDLELYCGGVKERERVDMMNPRLRKRVHGSFGG